MRHRKHDGPEEVAFTLDDIYGAINANDIEGALIILEGFGLRCDFGRYKPTAETNRLIRTMLAAASAASARGELDYYFAKTLIGRIAKTVDLYVFLRTISDWWINNPYGEVTAALCDELEAHPDDVKATRIYEEVRQLSKDEFLTLLDVACTSVNNNTNALINYKFNKPILLYFLSHPIILPESLLLAYMGCCLIEPELSEPEPTARVHITFEQFEPDYDI